MPFDIEQLHINIFDHSLVAYSVVELVLNDAGQPVDWIYRYCNQAFADVKEYRLDAMIGHSCAELSPRMSEKWLQAYYRAAFENEPCELDLTMEKQYHVSIMPIGKKGFCSSMLHEISSTAVPTDNGKLQNTEKYVIDKLSPEYVSVYRIELNSGAYQTLRLAANTNAQKIVDDAPEPFNTFDEYVACYMDSFILEEDKAEFADWFCCANMKKRLQHTDRITCHYHSVSPEGEHSFYEAYAVKGKINEQQYNIFLGFRNVDSILYKEKAIQEKLQNALQDIKLRNEIISSIAKTYQYISRIDIEADRYEEISNRDENQLDYKKTGVLSTSNEKNCRRFVAKEYQEAFLKFVDIKTLAERMQHEETIVMEYRMKDGNWHKLRFIEKKRDANGKLTHAICVARTISDVKKKEQRLRYQMETAQEDAALKARFLSNMSHDIRTPLNGVIGMIDMAGHYPNDLEMQEKCRDKAMQSLKYLVSLVNDVLDMNKLESGELVDQELTFDLAELLSRANTDKQMQAADKNIDYVVDWDRSTINHRYLTGNPIYVERMLSIISDNAVKFTNPGGSVRVWCQEKFADEKRVVYEFGCEDSGIGMSEEFLAHAFDMFAQENETSRTEYEGSGLGLPIAHKLVQRMGGTIHINSQRGRGTTVTMMIPFKIGEPDKVQSPMNYEDVSVEGLRALVVEDNDLNLEIATFLLENNGIDVESAKDGLEAVDKFEHSTPGYYDVIFMDIMMPNLNGWDATRKIRSMKRADADRVPIIAMSANAFAEDIINSRISGMNQHLMKPLSEKKVLRTLKECVEQSGDAIISV